MDVWLSQSIEVLHAVPLCSFTEEDDVTEIGQLNVTKFRRISRVKPWKPSDASMSH